MVEGLGHVVDAPLIECLELVVQIAQRAEEDDGDVARFGILFQ